VYDAIVVGARCAGAALAMLLARRGHRVALVDRAVFPSDTLSTHFLWQRGAARLQAWGVLDRLLAHGCEPLAHLSVDFGPVTLRGQGTAVDGIQQTYCPRRTVLDTVLVDAAVAAGAQLFDGCAVDALEWSDGRVTGIRGRQQRSGTRLQLSGRVVVGADGLHSTVARQVAAETYQWRAPLTCVYYAYWSGIQPRQAVFHPRPGRLVLEWPTNAGLTCIYVAWPHAEFRRFRADLERNFLASLALVPGLPDRVASGHRETAFRGTADLPNQYRTSHGPGWALVGDAGHHKDPATGLGMSDAFVSAQLLADALELVFADRRSSATALAAYARDRDAATADGLRLTLRTAALAPVPEPVLAYYAAAAGEPDEVDLILGVMGGAVRFEDVYSRGHISAALSPGSRA